MERAKGVGILRVPTIAAIQCWWIVRGKVVRDAVCKNPVTRRDRRFFSENRGIG